MQAIERQAEDMVSKLGHKMQCGEISEAALYKKIAATQQWREVKERDVRDQLAAKVGSVREAIRCALTPIIMTFKFIDENVRKQELAEDGASMDDDDMGSLVGELNGGLETLSLEDSLSYACCYARPCVVPALSVALLLQTHM